MTRAHLTISRILPNDTPQIAMPPGCAPARPACRITRPSRPLAIVTIVPTLRGKPRAHYGRILIGPKHAAAVVRRFRTAKLGEFGGFLTFAITGERQDG